MITTAVSRFSRVLRNFAQAMSFAGALGLSASIAYAAPEASHVMDARTGETLFEKNSETKLHPASLTKMLTLYIAFQEIEQGRLSLDSMITVSANAAAQPPSRLGLKAGQKIQLRFLIRAAAIKSANDAAQAIGDAIGGNQANFAERMTRTARALGMRNSTFKNASGLTAKGHLSTAKDMSILGRHLFYDFPQYYNIFSRRQTNAGLAEVANTNRRFLDAYIGADGIKTGFTQAAGFNLTASAEQNGVRLIATLFGGDSTADRNAKVAKLLDRGFDMAKRGVREVPPAPPAYQNADDELIASALPEDGLPEGGIGASAKTVRAITAPTSSPHPMPRPNIAELADGAEVLVAEMAGSIAGALAEVAGGAPVVAAPDAPLPFAVVAADQAETLAAPALDNSDLALAAADLRPAPRPAQLLAAPAPQVAPQTAQIVATPAAEPIAAPPENSVDLATAAIVPSAPQIPAAPPPPPPAARQAPIFDAETILAKASATAAPSGPAAPAPAEVVTRLSTSGGHHWGVNIGRFASSDAAERILLKTQLVESATLGGSLRKVTQKGGGFDANFLGLSQEAAELACRRLTARTIPCITLGP